MNITERFGNVLRYSASIGEMCRSMYPGNLEYTFCSDFATADWFGEKSVRDTYSRVKKNWGNDYKTATEIVVALNLLAWVYDGLSSEYEGCVSRSMMYSQMYHEAVDWFHEKYKDDREALEWFFEMTD